MKNLVLFGAGGLARETVEVIKAINAKEPTYRFLGFVVDDKYYRPNVMIGDYPLLGSEDWLVKNKDNVVCCCAIGTPSARANIQQSLSAKGVIFESVIAPNVFIGERSRIGTGCLLSGNVGISVDCTLGDGVFMNSGAELGHDVTIGSYTCMMGRVSIAGWVAIGEQVYIGGSAFIIPKRKIGARATIAAGSVVFTNVKAGTTVLGNPAKRMTVLEGF